jgi:hypothetical protein
VVRGADDDAARIYSSCLEDRKQEGRERGLIDLFIEDGGGMAMGV